MLDRHDIATPPNAASRPKVGQTQILIVGGYGHVGRLICQQLSERINIAIVVGGRNLSMASILASSIEGRGVRLDLDDPQTWDEACDGIDWVVMCMDQKDVSFVRFVFDRGIHYIDITANDRLLQSIEQLAPSRSTALLSVGLAPGLTNVLASFCASRLDRTERVEIGLLFGLGDKHGDAAIEWMADQLFDNHRDLKPAAMIFGFELGRRTTYPIDFSDQHSLQRTLPVDLVTTRLAFESRLASWGIFALGKIFSGNQLIRRLAVKLFKQIRMGSSICNVSVTASGWHQGRPATTSAHFSGVVEATVTARLSVLQIEQFLAVPTPPGIYHAHQVLDAQTVLASVASRNIGLLAIEPVRTFR